MYSQGTASPKTMRSERPSIVQGIDPRDDRARSTISATGFTWLARDPDDSDETEDSHDQQESTAVGISNGQRDAAVNVVRFEGVGGIS
jgi:hypothetical protein